MSHVAAGGRLPGAGVLTLLFLALSAQGALLFGSRRRRRLDLVTLVLGGTQFALHGAFHLLPAPGGARHSAMAAGGEHHAAGPPGGHDGGHVMDTGMVLAHAAATLGSALCVIHGERVLRRLAALFAPRVALRPTPPPLPCPPRSRPVPPVVARILFGALLARSCHRRGPPAAAVA
ncbi:hypothetical protein ABZ154_20745 [Streptomyces sp. NPDC006261]|uniref:hypothetical protein n=1 Tax=Streptomyces sp. NPDC006261 TaxID=3156739 RepID=UPI0033BC8D34